MNILTDALPTSLLIGDTEYQIDSDFRTCLRIILAFEDNELTNQEKQIILLSSLFVTVPSDTKEAIKQAIIFLDGGKSPEEDTNHVRVYSFEKDSSFIFAAFRQTHGINLQEINLHWWIFLALFMDLGSETTFSQLVSLRKRLKTGKATKEERQSANEIKDLLELPEIDDRDLEQKQAARAFDEAIRRAQEKRNNGRLNND